MRNSSTKTYALYNWSNLPPDWEIAKRHPLNSIDMENLHPFQVAQTSHFIFFQLCTDNNFQYFSYTVQQLCSSNQDTATIKKSFSNASIRLPFCQTPAFWPLQHSLYCHNTTIQVAFPSATSELIFSLPFNIYLWSLIYWNLCSSFRAS